MKTFKLNFIIIWLLCCSTAIAQNKKLDKTYKTNKDVTVKVDATHTNLIVEYWDRNEVQVEAMLEGPGKEGKNLKKTLDNWTVDTRATAGEITINSAGGTSWNANFDMAALQEPLAKLPEMMAPLQEMIGPLLESISGNPLPPDFYAKMGDLHFDYEAYRKDGDKYLEKFEKRVEKNFGEDFEKSMEEWAANFEKNMDKEMEKNMEAWGEKFGEDMEVWGEKFGKDMEKWAEGMEVWAQQIEEDVEEKYADSQERVIIINGKDGGLKKILKVKMPKDGQLKLNVRHGDVKLGGISNNLKADLAHSKLIANTLTGTGTVVKAAYSPVQVKKWNYGVLNASYAPEIIIDHATSIKLDSNSSDVRIVEIGEEGIIKGSFGELIIDRVSAEFDNLDIGLQNSDLLLDLPEVAYLLNYNGTKSEVKFPEGLNLKSSKSYDNQKLKGFNKNRNASAVITIDADFSDVILK